jgi:hypothetical protein
VYSLCLRPWISLSVDEQWAEMLRRLHPLRMQRYLISDMNPWMLPVKILAEQVKAHRCQAADDNLFSLMGKNCGETLEFSFDYYRALRDQVQEYLFQSLYDSPMARFFFGEKSKESEVADQAAGSDSREREKARLRRLAEKGGFVEACVRIMTAMGGANRIIDVREFQVAERIVQGNKTLRALPQAEFKRIVREQARILAVVPQKAIRSLRVMSLSLQERLELLRIAETIARADRGFMENRGAKILASLKQVLHREGRASSQRAGKVLPHRSA